MRFLAIVGVIVVVIASLFQLDHYEWFQKPRDMGNIRQQFHLPDSATFVHFDSQPKTFRPEGLRSEAVVQFSDAAFAAYLAKLDSREVWRPVPLTSYSPAIGETYSEDALQWRNLPIPQAVLALAKQRRLTLPYEKSIRAGKYFCSVIETRPAGYWESNPAAIRWKTFGESCHALTPSSSVTVIMFGILDTDQRLLHVALGFSG